MKSVQSVYLVTKKLKVQGRIKSLRTHNEWVFFSGDVPDELLLSYPGCDGAGAAAAAMTAAQFEDLAWQIFSQRYGTPLEPALVMKVPRLFLQVSQNGQVVGDAKFYPPVGEIHVPQARLSAISELAWLLGKTQARHTFIVFGSDIETPRRWLAKYGHLRGRGGVLLLGV